MMKPENRGPEDGDKVSAPCVACGDRYSYVVGGRGNGRRCPDCTTQYEQLERITGSMRISDDALRDEIVDRIEDDEYGVWVDERVGDIFVYDRTTSE